MTVLAGAFSRLDDATLPDALCAELLRAISRHPGDRPATYRDQRCLLAKIDVGAYGEPAFREEAPGSVCLLAGEPLLTLNQRQTGRSRSHDLEILHRELRRGHWNVLAAAHGVFSLAHYERTTGQLTLSTDKLGIRPLYYWVGERYVVFASALRILEGIQAVPKEMDVRAVTEIAAIGFPLGTRTPYLGIRVLDAAEVLRLTAREEIHTRYWRWDAVGPGGELFPALDADIKIEAASRDVTTMTLDGVYRPPLGWVGAGLDRVLLGRIATATARRFLASMALAIADPATTERAREPAWQVESGWLPPAPEQT